MQDCLISQVDVGFRHEQTVSKDTMTSSSLTRPSGTDGSDHWHRESIAWQYKVSSINKGRMKWCLALHISLWIWLMVRMMPAITSLFGFNIQRLRRWDLPAPRLWEYAWLLSIMPALIGWQSLHRSNSFALKQHMLGVTVFGLLPVFLGLFDQGDDLLAYVQERKYTYVMFGFPAVALWSLFLLVALQVHAFGLYFSYILVKAWRPRVPKAKVK